MIIIIPIVIITILIIVIIKILIIMSIKIIKDYSTTYILINLNQFANKAPHL